MSGVVSDVTSDNGWQFLCEQNVPTGTMAETPFRIQGTIPHPFLWDTEHPHLYLLKTMTKHWFVLPLMSVFLLYVQL